MSFTDEALGACVSEYAVKHGYRFIDEIVELECDGLNILSIEGMEQFADISPMALRRLSLKWNGIRDITPLAQLTDLRQLYLGGWTANTIEDLTPLSGMVELNSLSFNSTRAVDMEPLRTMTKLESLHIDGEGNDVGPSGGLRDLSPLASMTMLRALEIRDNYGPIVLTPLVELKQLRSLHLVHNEILSDICALAELTELQHLTLRNFNRNIPRDDLQVISSMTSLVSLSVEGHALDLSYLSDLEMLESLSIADPVVADLSPLSGLSSLHSLTISSHLDIDNAYYIGPLSDLAPLGALTNLSRLAINYTRIEDLSPLAELDKLSELDLTRNYVSNVTPLTGLPALSSIDLRKSRFLSCADVEALQSAQPHATIYSDCSGN